MNTKHSIKLNKIIIVILTISIAFILGYSSSKYYTKDTILNDNIVSYNDTDMAIILKDGDNYVESSSVPLGGYTLDQSSSFCGSSDNINSRDSSITLTYKNGQVSVSGLSTKGTRCYLYFDELPPTAARDYILAGKKIEEAPTTITGVSTANHDDTLYTAEDDWGTSYIFRGAITNNWFVFDKDGTNYIWWRIVRINGDNTVRMIYAGTSASDSVAPSTTGTGTQIQFDGHSGFCFSQDCAYSDNIYIGYMYGSKGASAYSTTHANTNNSYAKQIIDSWYNSNLKTNYGSYLSGSTGFCGDRSTFSGAGYGTTKTIYAAYNRATSTHIMNLKCSNKSNDLYTTFGSREGNKALNNPIGMLTVDEAMLAGGYTSSNSNYYLYTNANYWLISPYQFDGGYAGSIYVRNSGAIDFQWPAAAGGLRPVVNLSAGTLITGNGTSANPYKIKQ